MFYLIGALVTFVVIKYINFIFRKDECYNMAVMEGWSMVFFVVLSWFGLFSYFIMLLLFVLFSFPKYCPDKSNVTKIMKKINDNVYKIFR